MNKTTLIAQIAEKSGLTRKQAEAALTAMTDTITETLKAKYVAIGSPTLNNGMMPSVAAFLTYLKGLTPKSRKAIGIAFGSYGWSGQSVGMVEAEMKECGFEMPFGIFREQWVPADEVLASVKKTISDGLDELRA